MKIYTKTGDRGDTGLVGGKRISKADLRIETYGELDELNAQVGMLKALLSKDEELSFEQKRLGVLDEIQKNLFTLGSNLACEKEQRIQFKLPVLTSEDVLSLETSIDDLQEQLSELKNFILPGGSLVGASAHVARTVSRRVERKLVLFFNHYGEETPELSLEYINRLSDYFFVFSRWLNHQKGCEETIWKG